MHDNRWISDLHWRRESRQTRGQRTQDALLDAAEELFAERGSEAVPVNEVAERAGVSVGALYHHFRDKKALLLALYERMTREFEATGRDALDPARWQGAGVIDILRGFLGFSMRLAHEKPASKRAAMEALAFEPGLRRHYAEMEMRLMLGMKALLDARGEEICHPDPDFATRFVIDQLGAMLKARQDAAVRETQLAQGSDEAFVEAALDFARGYLAVRVAD